MDILALPNVVPEQDNQYGGQASQSSWERQSRIVTNYHGSYHVTILILTDYSPLQLFLLITQQVSMEIWLTIVMCDWICKNKHRIILTNPVPNTY